VRHLAKVALGERQVMTEEILVAAIELAPAAGADEK
jgi:hypothetical protein